MTAQGQIRVATGSRLQVADHATVVPASRPGRAGIELARSNARMRKVRSEAGYTLVEILVVAGIIGVISAIAVPMTDNALKNFRVSGDARSLSNAIGLAKMRAAATFNRARLYVDLSTLAYRLETYDKTTPAWVVEQGATYLSTGVSFSYGGLTSAPPNTQATIAQAPQCRNAAGSAIGNTACIVFNSRGIPIDSTGAPTGIDALYVSDGTVVYGATVSATGLVRMWRRQSSSAPWTKQ